MNNYIKLNNNENHLSLGNLFNMIKKLAKNKSSAVQTEIFCLLFNIENISPTTVNNYCIGCRSIGSEYKQIYLNYHKKYLKNKNVLIDNINNICSLMDGYVYNYKTIKDLNNLDCLKNLVNSLHILVKNDLYVSNNLKKEILELINKNLYYEALIKMLFFIILDKKQPIYEQDEIKDTIEEIISKTNLSINDLKEYLQIKFQEGISLISSLKKLAKKNNPCALHELGNLEYKGEITGYPRYDIAYNYYQKAANYEYPTSCWMIAHMIINKKIGSLSKEDIKFAWLYLSKAERLGSTSALNTIGICYKYGYTINRQADLKKAIDYFERAIKKKYVYAYNNLGLIYEEKKDYKEAFNYFIQAANYEESWACNKVANYYLQGIYVKKDLKKALEYYTIGANSPIENRCYWNNHNLVKHYYLYGVAELGIKKDIDKCLKILDSNKQFEYDNELYLYIYYEKYIERESKENLDKVSFYLNKINTSIIYDEKRKKEIETNIKKIYNYQIKL